MKISGKVSMHIKYRTHLFGENPSGLHNSLNLRPEPLAEEDDNLPLNVGHYIWDLGLEEGLGAMRVFIDLSTTTHHMK